VKAHLTRLFEKYTLFYAIAIILSGLALMAVGVQETEVYYAIYLIEFLIAVELAAPFRRSLEKQLRPIIAVFVLGFGYILLQRIIQILSGAGSYG
jgi:hypothetical protein